MKNKSSIFLLFSVVFFVISIYNFYNYFEYKEIIDKGDVIEYTFVQKEKRGGRGSYYIINVMYKNTTFSVSVNSKVYYMIDENVFPDLYYSDMKDSVFSEWDKKSSLRVFFMFLIGFIITLVGAIFYKRKMVRVGGRV